MDSCVFLLYCGRFHRPTLDQPEIVYHSIDANAIDKTKAAWYNLSGLGEMSERFKEPVLKTGDPKRAVGSNPTLSATHLPYIRFDHGEVLKLAEEAPLLRV